MIILMMKLGTQQLRVRAMLFAAADAAALQRGLRIDAVSQEKTCWQYVSRRDTKGKSVSLVLLRAELASRNPLL